MQIYSSRITHHSAWSGANVRRGFTLIESSHAVAQSPCRRGSAKAFTLIELSIALVIIGLVVGGVLVGKDLISASEIRGTISQIDKYKAAYQTFRLKYNCIAGDCRNASQFGLVGGYYNNVNGDGDGLIYSYQDGTTLADGLPKFAEGWGALAHLGSAGLIEKAYTYDMGISTSNVPIKGNFLWFTSLRPATPPSGYTMPDSGGNYLYIGSFSVNGSNIAYSFPTLIPSQAYSIDNKMDDGLPMSGAVRASAQRNACPGITIPASDWGACFNTPFKASQAATYGVSASQMPVDDSVSPPIYNITNSDFAYTSYTSIHIRVD